MTITNKEMLESAKQLLNSVDVSEVDSIEVRTMGYDDGTKGLQVDVQFKRSDMEDTE